MPAIEKHSPGDFCWAELATTNLEAAKKFYGPLFGWTWNDMPMPTGVYSMVQLEGLDLGAMYQLTEMHTSRGIPPHWLAYVAVADTDDAIEKAKQMGGKLFAGPHEVPGAGRMGLLVDPQGAMFAVWQAKGHIGTRIGGAFGAPTWWELATSNTAQATGFYTSLFGWSAKVSSMGPMQYTEWSNAGRSVGGMIETCGEWKDVAPHWMAYFRVRDCDASFAQATELGGTVRVPPTDIPKVGRFAMLADPQGAVFSVIQLSE